MPEGLFGQLLNSGRVSKASRTPKSKDDIIEMMKSPIPWVAAVGGAYAALLAANIISLP